MFINSEADLLRQQYCDAWRLYEGGEPLTPLQEQLCAIIREHPEYQAELAADDKARARTYHPELGETNPFLHFGLHVAIREQISLDNPQGVKQVFTDLCQQTTDPHEAEHEMMLTLAESMHQVLQSGTAPDMAEYVRTLQSLINPKKRI